MWPFDIFSKKMKYTLETPIIYYSPRYEKYITVPAGYKSDGATGAPDLCERAFFVHDMICDHGMFDDGTPITNIQASTIYYDILAEEGFWLRKYDRWLATFLFGGKNLKKF